MPGLMRGVARTAVVAGTATAVSGRVARRQNARWASQEQPAPAYQEPPPQAAPPAAAPESDMDAKLNQLKTLADLKAQGILSEAEFAAEKAKVLGI